MNKLRFYLNKLLGKPTVAKFNLLGQNITLGISAAREIRRAHDIEIESQLLEHMRSSLQQNDVLYDVGANIGLISILMSTHPEGSSLKVLSFEPEPRNFEQLTNNLFLNQLEQRISCHQMALGATSGEITLHVRGTAGEGRHSIATDKGASGSIQVKLDTMSRVALDSEQSPTIVKIDVEGAEGQVLAGMEELIASKPPRDIFMEIHFKGDGDSMPCGMPIHDWLYERGYSMLWNNTRRSGEHRHYQFSV